MDNLAGVKTLLDFGLDRAFPNLYTVVIDGPTTNAHPDGNPAIQYRLENLKYYAEKLDFEGDFSFDTEYSEATKMFFIKNSNRIKKVTITFRETSGYSVIDVIKDWMSNIYNFETNVFKQWNPNGEINIRLDPIRTNQPEGNIRLQNTYPVNLKYPTYDWGDGNPIKISVTFVCSDVTFTIPKEE